MDLAPGWYASLALNEVEPGARIALIRLGCMLFRMETHLWISPRVGTAKIPEHHMPEWP
jgi:hypothetical protein